MSSIKELSDMDVEKVTGGVDKDNPYVLEIWFYNSETDTKAHFYGCYPTSEAAKAARGDVYARKAQLGYKAELTKIYKAI